METQLKPIILNLIAALIGAFGQYYYKIGAKKMSAAALVNMEIIIGAILFILVMVLFIWSYKIGGNISVTYPVYSLTFLFGIIIGIKFEAEPWSYLQLVGAAVIMLGIMIVIKFSPAN